MFLMRMLWIEYVLRVYQEVAEIYRTLPEIIWCVINVKCQYVRKILISTRRCHCAKC